MKQELKIQLTKLAMRIANDGSQGAFEDVLEVLGMVNNLPDDSVTVCVGVDNFMLTMDQHQEIGDLLANTKKIPAIKRLREIYQTQLGYVLGLKEAKDAVENTQNWDTWDTAPKPIYLPPEHCAICVNFTKHPNFVQARDHFNKAREAEANSPDVLEYDPMKVGNETEGMEAAINADPKAVDDKPFWCHTCDMTGVYNEGDSCERCQAEAKVRRM